MGKWDLGIFWNMKLGKSGSGETVILEKVGFEIVGLWINGILGKCVLGDKEIWKIFILRFNLYFFYKNEPLCMIGAAQEANPVVHGIKIEQSEPFREREESQPESLE